MNLLRLHLWREWREHRITLLMLILVLPLLSWGIARVPPKAVLGEPLTQSGAALAFVVVLLVATGGELLGLDRRGAGLRWLERLPTGLSTAFLAKLLFLAITITLAAVFGLGVARSIALLRGVEPRAVHWEPISFVAGATLVLWTFACSAWALRGGVAILAAASILGLVGYPAWKVVSEGYEPGAPELWTAGTLLLLGGVVSAMLAFLRGAKFGRGTGMATLLGLAPTVPLLAFSTAWSFDRIASRERIDPLAPEFGIHTAWVSEDGRTALVGCCMWSEGWNEVPDHVLRVDLGNGTWERVGGRNARIELSSNVDDGPLTPEAYACARGDEDPSAARLYLASDGALMTEKHVDEFQNGWVTTPAGFGWLILRGPFRPLPTLYDPRECVSVALHDLDLATYDEVYIGPERWLVRKDLEWFEYTPGEPELMRAQWMDEVTDPGPMLSDGRMFAALGDRGFGLVDPAKQQITSLCTSENGAYWLSSAYAYHDHPVFRSGEIVLLDNQDGRFLFDELSTTLIRVSGETWEDCVRSFPDGTVILVDEHGRLVRQDLETDAREVLFPRLSSN